MILSVSRWNPEGSNRPQKRDTRGMWVKYGKEWYSPLEWSGYKLREDVRASYADYYNIHEILEEARAIIIKKANNKEDVSGLLARYFAFEQRVIDYYEKQLKLANKDMPWP